MSLIKAPNKRKINANKEKRKEGEINQTLGLLDWNRLQEEKKKKDGRTGNEQKARKRKGRKEEDDEELMRVNVPSLDLKGFYLALASERGKRGPRPQRRRGWTLLTDGAKIWLSSAAD